MSRSCCSRETNVSRLRVPCVSLAIVALITVVLRPLPMRADHICDPVSEDGWNLVKSHEPTRQVDGAPYQADGNWYVDRSTTVVPFCHYFNPLGIYSMRSYSLAPVTTQERVALCQGAAGGGSTPIVPYTGPCPPK